MIAERGQIENQAVRRAYPHLNQMVRLEKQLVLFSIIAICCAVNHEYSREFQITLDDDYFIEEGRTKGIERYLESFAVKGFTITEGDMTVESSYRYQSSIPLGNCDSDAKVRLREYIQGDRTGFTYDLKSGESLTEAEALAEPFTIATEYTAESKYEIEYDVHPCRADYAATARIYFDTAIDFPHTCADVRKYFPDFSNADGNLNQDDSIKVVYAQTYNGEAWGGEIKLEFTFYYDSLEDAVEDSNLEQGEFSITIYAPAGTTVFTDEQTSEGIEVYEYMLNDVGDNDYPCDPDVDIAQFFDEDYQNGVNSNSSSVLTLCSSLFVLICIFMF